MIRYRQIEAFRAVMRTGTTVGAARELNVSQPAISRLISELEESTGFALFSRSTGRLCPTQNGQRFYQTVEEAFLGMERLEHAAEMIRFNSVDEFVLTCQPVFATSLLPAILSDFEKKCPQVLVRIESIRTQEALALIQNRKALAAICQAFAPIPGVASELLIRVQALCAMPQSHRLASRKVIRPCDLLGERMIGSHPHGSWSLDRDLIGGTTAGLPHYTYLADTIHTRFALVAAGFGLSIVDPCAANLWSRQGVVVRPFAEPHSHDYVIAFLDSERDAPLLSEFRNSALRVLKEHAITESDYFIRSEQAFADKRHSNTE
ncbi:LysR family transcriptional regulator [Burkholderia stagnalis]|uniref:LysR family transcriptional regulator n=1 Tax=Burkholderia stagnalis TaxID=1503054 RepID=A0ABX9YCI3_9BURK|nr:LysR substrate-binding domain-containing protein [Burkholderia stagnalis]RQQ45693.1 LysR family transcriptional regulator [Burkholderia stagnalis]RQQ59033.1 LysR family transcriptional regulator [Burkholderia stagnalis]RQQ59504.1 LysR family transcriptional regulator [Burkholderia stagnalis]RQQ73865.1 LysR family transcriptional regulator [Burkholderia stagnalis]RQQ78810.1 LysR family transcriptional regulator [Burkholderia stagnalis]